MSSVAPLSGEVTLYSTYPACWFSRQMAACTVFIETKSLQAILTDEPTGMVLRLSGVLTLVSRTILNVKSLILLVVIS